MERWPSRFGVLEPCGDDVIEISQPRELTSQRLTDAIQKFQCISASMQSRGQYTTSANCIEWIGHWQIRDFARSNGRHRVRSPAAAAVSTRTRHSHLPKQSSPREPELR